MNKVNAMTSVFLLTIIVSWNILGPIETVTDVLLLLGIRWLQPVRLRSRSLALLALIVAAAWADWFVVDVWFSCFLMIGRHLGLLLIALSVLYALRRERPGLSTPPPRIRGRILLAFGLLIVSVGSLIAFADNSVPEFLVAAVLAVVGHFAIILRGLWIRWGRSSLLYPVGILSLAAFFGQLAWDSLYLHTVWKVNSQQLVWTEDRISPLIGINIPEPLLSAKLDCIRHKDPAVRRNALRRFGYEIYEASWEEKTMPAFPSYDDVEWWKHAYWDGAWPNSLAERIMPVLIESLEDDNGKVRYRAAEQFTYIGPLGRPAIPALSKLLRDHGDVAGSQVEQDGEYGFSDLLVLQVKGLDQLRQGFSPGLTRGIVAKALGSIGPRARDAVPDLIPLLRDVFWPVRVKAANALGNMGPFAQDAIQALEAAAQDEMFGAQSQIAAANALWKIDPEHSLTVPIFQEFLNNGTSEERKDVASRIARMGLRGADWAIPNLIPILDAEDLEVRDAAIMALCYVGVESQEAVEAVLKTLQPGGRAANDSKRPWQINQYFRRLVENARGPGATAMATGIRNIESHYWRWLLSGPRLQECDPQVLAALQEMR